MSNKLPNRQTYDSISEALKTVYENNFHKTLRNNNDKIIDQIANIISKADNIEITKHDHNYIADYSIYLRFKDTDTDVSYMLMLSPKTNYSFTDYQ